MYRHSAESIRETDNKMFVSLEEKTKFNNYENTLRRKDDSYSKTEVDNKIKELSDSTYGNVESTYVSESNTIDGYIKDLEILGNTVQNTEDLADIKSVGELQEDNTYKMSIVSCGKNLFDKTKTVVGYVDTNGTFISGGGSIISDYIKVKPNINYINNKNLEKVIFYDKDKKFIELILGNNFPQIPDGCVYARVQYGNESTTTDTLQIEEGTISTPYEPYQESRVDINLPCQLEKVGDISDRLYYDEEEKVWCIEKNIEKIIFTGSDLEGWAHKTFYDGNGKQYYGTPNDAYTFKAAGGISEFPVFISGDITRDYNGTAMTCSKTYGTIDYSVNIATLSEFKTWVNGKSIYVVPETSKKIILPLSTQIQLNSYANRTHIYTVSGDIEPTIKATLPKSLGANVQSLNYKTDTMNTRIKAIETLKEGQNLSYESDKGYVVCENTNNGQIDNIKIEGKTLVNLVKLPTSKDNITASTTGLVSICGFNFTNSSNIKPNQEYTAICNFTINSISNNGVPYLESFYKSSTANHWVNATFSNNNKQILQSLILYFKTGSDVLQFGSLHLGLKSLDGATANIDISLKDVYLIEGDYTQNPPSYFEGLMSVGGGVDEIEVISRKEDGNLWDGTYELGGIWTESAEDSTNILKKRSYYIPVRGLTMNVKITDIVNSVDDAINIHAYDIYKKPLKWNTGKYNYYITDNNQRTLTLPDGCAYVKFRTEDNRILTSNSVILTQKNDISNNEIHKSHNKSLLYYNDLGELTPVPELHEWDSIEKHSDGKWYYHKRSEKVVFDGSSDEDWKLNTSSETTQSFRCAHSINMIQNLICDRFVHDSISSNNGVEGILVSKVNNPNEFSIEILKTKLSSVDVTGFKQWLSSNNVTVVYELAEEEVYECVNLNLDTYGNETMVMVNTGAITPNISFNVSSHIGNTVSILRERLKSIEEEYTQYKLNKDRLLLNARYKSDKGSFNVSIISLSSNEEEIDYELFALTKSVIELSLNKIDIIYMENLIDFYTLVGKFDYDMADILFEMIENQINPPVIEIPEEEISIEI